MKEPTSRPTPLPGSDSLATLDDYHDILVDKGLKPKATDISVHPRRRMESLNAERGISPTLLLMQVIPAVREIPRADMVSSFMITALHSIRHQQLRDVRFTGDRNWHSVLRPFLRVGG